MLIDLLRFGRRRQLAALEPIGRRFHVLIDVGLSSAPFICIKYLACPIERPAWHFKKLDEQNKLHDVKDGKVHFFLVLSGFSGPRLRRMATVSWIVGQGPGQLDWQLVQLTAGST